MEHEDPLALLRTHFKENDELMELVDTLAVKGRHDLIRLIRDYQLPPLLNDAEIVARVGSAEAVERQLLDIHESLRPIVKRRYEAANTEPTARRFYRLMCSGKINLRGTINDPSWNVDFPTRRKLLDLWACARPDRPDEPVAYDDLKSALQLKSIEEVRDLILLLRERHNWSTSERKKDKKNKGKA